MYGMKRTTIYLPEDLKAALERTAAMQGRSEAAVVRDAVAEATASHRDPSRHAAAARLLAAEDMEVPSAQGLRDELDELRGRSG